MGAAVNDAFDPRIELEVDGDRITLHLTVNEDFRNVRCDRITSDLLGEAFQPEARFENADGSDVVMDRDYTGNAHTDTPMVGPFEMRATGRQTLRVWPKRRVRKRSIQ